MFGSVNSSALGVRWARHEFPRDYVGGTGGDHAHARHGNAIRSHRHRPAAGNPRVVFVQVTTEYSFISGAQFIAK
jgi:hypothetical protein